MAMEIDAWPPKDKPILKTLTGQQQDLSNKKHRKNHDKLAHKRAITLYAEEKVKPDGKSAEVVCAEVMDVLLKYRGNILYFTVGCACLPVQICTR